MDRGGARRPRVSDLGRVRRARGLDVAEQLVEQRQLALVPRLVPVQLPPT